MKRKTLTLTAAAAVIALGAAAAFATQTAAHGPMAYRSDAAVQDGYGPGMGHMGYGMMGHGWGRGMMGQGWGHGHGYGMMGPGRGHGMMGYGPGGGYADCPAFQAAAEDMTVDDVKAMLERRLEMWGNERLKVGAVTEQDDRILGEIVTQDGSLVDKFAFDRRSGRMTRVE
jgi:hypothetical protein